MPVWVTNDGTQASTVQHDARVTWPSVFVHVCEAKQVVNKFGEVASLGVMMSSMAYASEKEVCRVLEAGGTQECMAVHLLRHHAKPRRLRTKSVPPAILQPLKRKKAKTKHASETTLLPSPPKRVRTTQTQPTPVGEEPPPEPPQEHVRCACNGICARSPPMCPSRKRFYRCRLTNEAGCPNPARILDPTNKRHFCWSCRCRVAGPLACGKVSHHHTEAVAQHEHIHDSTFPN